MGKMTGIVLAGGKSTRMGKDKAFIRLNDKYLYETAAAKLSEVCSQVYISVNKKQAETHSFNLPVCIDLYEDQGPVGGLISAYQQVQPPFLILAVDMIHVQRAHILDLMHHHQSAHDCTLYINAHTGYYEPLFSIWEKQCLDDLAIYFDNGGRSFQHYLKSGHINSIACDTCDFLFNANTPDKLKNL